MAGGAVCQAGPNENAAILTNIDSDDMFVIVEAYTSRFPDPYYTFHIGDEVIFVALSTNQTNSERFITDVGDVINNALSQRLRQRGNSQLRNNVSRFLELDLEREAQVIFNDTLLAKTSNPDVSLSSR